MKKTAIIYVIAIFFLVLLQTSFFARFGIFDGRWPQTANLVIVLLVVASLFEKQKSNLGLSTAVAGGVFLDVYSERFFGFWILVLLAVYFAIRYVVKRYVRIPPVR